MRRLKKKLLHNLNLVFTKSKSCFWIGKVFHHFFSIHDRIWKWPMYITLRCCRTINSTSFKIDFPGFKFITSPFQGSNRTDLPIVSVGYFLQKRQYLQVYTFNSYYMFLILYLHKNQILSFFCSKYRKICIPIVGKKFNDSFKPMIVRIVQIEASITSI